MATILKQTKASGVRYKAVIKLHGRIVKTKTFKTKNAACTWAKQTEGNLAYLDALGLPGASITVEELAKEYLKQAWRGKDHSRPARVMWWVEQIGNIKLADFTPKLIRKYLSDYLDGEGQRACGKLNGKTQYQSTGIKRSNSSYNQLRVALSAMLKYAMEKDYLNANPVRNVSSKPENNGRVRYLSDEERERLFLPLLPLSAVERATSQVMPTVVSAGGVIILPEVFPAV